jgi:hypothetical protein
MSVLGHVKKFTLKIKNPLLKRYFLSDWSINLFVVNPIFAFQKFGKYLGVNEENFHNVHLEMVKQGWINADWLKYREWHLANLHSHFIYRGINARTVAHFNAAWRKILTHGNDRVVDDDTILGSQIKMPGYDPGETIWGENNLSRVMDKYTSGNLRLVGVYDSKKLSLIESDDGDVRTYARKLAPGVSSFKEALVAVIVIMIQC